jgi:hypothetical protein
MQKLDYLRDYMDYCIVSNEHTRIHGFKENSQVNLNQFELISTQLQMNTYNSLISPVRNGVFMAANRTKLVAFDISTPNIMSNENRFEININEGIAYLVKNSYDAGQYQYAVTIDGKLIRMRIRNKQIERENVNTVGSGDTVIVAGDNAYILGNRTVNGRSSGDIEIKSCNSTDRFTINLSNGRFTPKEGAGK